MHKKGRPTLQDALDYLRDGVFSIGRHDYVSWEDREKALCEFESGADALLRTHLDASKNRLSK